MYLWPLWQMSHLLRSASHNLRLCTFCGYVHIVTAYLAGKKNVLIQFFIEFTSLHTWAELSWEVSLVIGKDWELIWVSIETAFSHQGLCCCLLTIHQFFVNRAAAVFKTTQPIEAYNASIDPNIARIAKLSQLKSDSVFTTSQPIEAKYNTSIQQFIQKAKKCTESAFQLLKYLWGNLKIGEKSSWTMKIKRRMWQDWPCVGKIQFYEIKIFMRWSNEWGFWFYEMKQWLDISWRQIAKRDLFLLLLKM